MVSQVQKLFSCPNLSSEALGNGGCHRLRWAEWQTPFSRLNFAEQNFGGSILKSLIDPRTASATRALLRLMPCHRAETVPTEVGVRLFPAPLH